MVYGICSLCSAFILGHDQQVNKPYTKLYIHSCIRCNISNATHPRPRDRGKLVREGNKKLNWNTALVCWSNLALNSAGS